MSTVLGPPQGYIDLFLTELEASTKKAHEANKAFQRTPIRPSNAGKCEREIYFDLMQYAGKASYPTEPNAGETELLLNLGHYIESHIINMFKRHLKVAEVTFQQQVLDFGKIEAANDKRLSQHLQGSLDLVLWSEQFKCCMDIKSKGDNYDFRARKQKWQADSEKLSNMESVEVLSDRSFWINDLDAFLEELDDPFFAANFKQLNMYCNSSFLKDRGIDHGAIVQYQKNKSLLREVRFRPSPTVFEKSVGLFHNTVKAVDSGNIELTKAEYPADSFKSRFCSYCKAKTPGSCAMVNAAKDEEPTGAPRTFGLRKVKI